MPRQSEPRTFQGLRRSDGVVETGPAMGSIEEALLGIAGTQDGRHLIAWLRHHAMQPTHPNATDAQLREAEGRRGAQVALLNMMEANDPVR